MVTSLGSNTSSNRSSNRSSNEFPLPQSPGTFEDVAIILLAGDGLNNLVANSSIGLATLESLADLQNASPILLSQSPPVYSVGNPFVVQTPAGEDGSPPSERIFVRGSDGNLYEYSPADAEQLDSSSSAFRVVGDDEEIGAPKELIPVSQLTAEQKVYIQEKYGIDADSLPANAEFDPLTGTLFLNTVSSVNAGPVYEEVVFGFSDRSGTFGGDVGLVTTSGKVYTSDSGLNDVAVLQKNLVYDSRDNSIRVKGAGDNAAYLKIQSDIKGNNNAVLSRGEAASPQTRSGDLIEVVEYNVNGKSIYVSFPVSEAIETHLANNNTEIENIEISQDGDDVTVAVTYSNDDVVYYDFFTGEVIASEAESKGTPSLFDVLSTPLKILRFYEGFKEGLIDSGFEMVEHIWQTFMGTAAPSSGQGEPIIEQLQDMIHGVSQKLEDLFSGGLSLYANSRGDPVFMTPEDAASHPELTLIADSFVSFLKYAEENPHQAGKIAGKVALDAYLVFDSGRFVVASVA
ncbi:MAG: hypothetical protein R3194_00235, partial [Limnobacter sp.]|nr:hypothetical protein [Limnobacter sp.]